MSVKQIARVWDHSPLRAERLLVHLAIADHMDHDGRGWVSWKQIQAKAKVGRTVVSYTIKELQDLGFLAVTDHARGTRSTVYQLLWPESDEPLGVQPVNGSAGEPVEPGRLGVQVTTSRGSSETSRGSSAAHSSVLTSVLPPSIEERPHSDECRQACNLLADLIEANGSRRPTITQRWLTDMDRLHRIDRRTWEQIENAIRWSQDHEFWRANIMSPFKLRKRYDQLRLQYQHEQSPTRKTGTSKAAGAIALINKMRGPDHHDPRGITGPADRSQLHGSHTPTGS